MCEANSDEKHYKIEIFFFEGFIKTYAKIKKKQNDKAVKRKYFNNTAVKPYNVIKTHDKKSSDDYKGVKVFFWRTFFHDEKKHDDCADS